MKTFPVIPAPPSTNNAPEFTLPDWILLFITTFPEVIVFPNKYKLELNEASPFVLNLFSICTTLLFAPIETVLALPPILKELYIFLFNNSKSVLFDSILPKSFTYKSPEILILPHTSKTLLFVLLAK